MRFPKYLAYHTAEWICFLYIFFLYLFFLLLGLSLHDPLWEGKAIWINSEFPPYLVTVYFFLLNSWLSFPAWKLDACGKDLDCNLTLSVNIGEWCEVVTNGAFQPGRKNYLHKETNAMSQKLVPAVPVWEIVTKCNVTHRDKQKLTRHLVDQSVFHPHSGVTGSKYRDLRALNKLSPNTSNYCP